ncbi:hypothetical protein BC936DRAFT_141314 [Jimgerdemannia flammicorona]|uniref:Uncharacterized protein n=1 Tax=Jimgerdemannia flammicorona TaxID=994334 RepID=A0A433DG85_9FUNG|nr:hypothetical protein BC936DRAFT_141314 [Jimgerdemannia flammicorona]
MSSFIIFFAENESPMAHVKSVSEANINSHRGLSALAVGVTCPCFGFHLTRLPHRWHPSDHPVGLCLVFFNSLQIFANLGGFDLANHYLLLGRPLYQDRLLEPVNSYGAITSTSSAELPRRIKEFVFKRRESSSEKNTVVEN